MLLSLVNRPATACRASYIPGKALGRVLGVLDLGLTDVGVGHRRFLTRILELQWLGGSRGAG